MRVTGWLMITAAGVIILAVAWRLHRKRLAGRAWAAEVAARIRAVEDIKAEIALLESWYAAESAEENT